MTLSCVCAAMLLGIVVVVSADEPKSGASSAAINGTVMEVQGKLLPADGTNSSAKFKTESGAVYTLVSNQTSSALFIDTNLHGKTLLLKGRPSPGANHFQVTGNLRSLRDGKIHELYYYCEICAIKGSESGPCMCCREPVHLIEKGIGEEP
jgi:hypothetical protein